MCIDGVPLQGYRSTCNQGSTVCVQLLDKAEEAECMRRVSSFRFLRTVVGQVFRVVGGKRGAKERQTRPTAWGFSCMHRHRVYHPHLHVITQQEGTKGNENEETFEKPALPHGRAVIASLASCDPFEYSSVDCAVTSLSWLTKGALHAAPHSVGVTAFPRHA